MRKLGLQFKKFERDGFKFMLIHDDFRFSRPVLMLKDEEMNKMIEEWRRK